jgi:hypothetical protein
VQVHRRSPERDDVHVGDGDEDLHVAVRERLGNRELIEIARVVVVDRAPAPVAKVARRHVARRRRFPKRVELGECSGWKVGIETVRAHLLEGDGAQSCAIGLRRRRLVH